MKFLNILSLMILTATTATLITLESVGIRTLPPGYLLMGIVGVIGHLYLIAVDNNIPTR